MQACKHIFILIINFSDPQFVIISLHASWQVLSKSCEAIDKRPYCRRGLYAL